MRAVPSTSQAQHRSTDDGGAALLFYGLATGFGLLFAVILWYFSNRI